MKLNLLGPSNKEDIVSLDAQDTVNMYLSPTLVQDKPFVLKQNSGLSLLIDTDGSEVRELIDALDMLYCVTDDTLYEITVNIDDKSATKTARGFLLTTSGYTDSAYSNLEIAITDSSNLYIYNISSGTLSTVLDPDFTGADSLIYINGRFVFVEPGTQKMWCTELLDGANIESLAFASAESQADNLIAVAVNKNEIWAFGKKTIEIFNGDDESLKFPFTRRTDVYMDIGLAAKKAFCNVLNGLTWLTDDRTIIYAADYNPQVISTDAIHSELLSFNRISDCRCYSYTERGHTFVVYTFPTANTTFVYDFITGYWHRRKSYIDEGIYGRHRANCHTFHKGLNVVGDYKSGKLLYYNPNINTEDSEVLLRQRVSSNFYNELPVSIQKITLIPEVGIGKTSGSATNPQVSMQYSVNGSRSYSNELFASLGKLGDYKQRVEWGPLGTTQVLSISLTCTDDVPFNILDAYIEAEPGVS